MLEIIENANWGRKDSPTILVRRLLSDPILRQDVVFFTGPEWEPFQMYFPTSEYGGDGPSNRLADPSQERGMHFSIGIEYHVRLRLRRR